MPFPNHYQLSNEADLDIEEIFDYTEAEFGTNQAIFYVSRLEEVFEMLIVNPALGKARDEILPGLRSLPKPSHVVFYRVLPDCIRIVRVLHGSRDISRFFE